MNAPPLPARHGLRAPATASTVLIDAEAYYAAFYRAAAGAERHILLAGWQFDTTARLLRGEAAREAPYPVEFLPFLDALCRARPQLRIYMLAWDHSLVYAFEREWLQSLKVGFQANRRIRLEFDAHPNLVGSHHQKLVVIDGALAFVGGTDLCEMRWDDRRHLPRHALRVDLSGQPARPNHELQAAVQGPAAGALLRVFLERWERALGERLPLTPHPTSSVAKLDLAPLEPAAILPLRAREVTITRTLSIDGWPPKREVLAAYSAMLYAAEELIYIETQYFTSQALTAAFAKRLASRQRPRLSVVVVMPQVADNSKEEFALGELQSATLAQLQQLARSYGHELRLLCCQHPDCETAVFIHSKLLIVDDRLLAVGSANMTDRSMTLDSEVCLLWQAQPGSALEADIRALRTSLLAEHSGEPAELFASPQGLIERLDRMLEKPGARLRRRTPHEAGEVSPLKKAIFDPRTLDVDLE